MLGHDLRQVKTAVASYQGIGCMHEKCNNNGPFCMKTATTPVPHARKVQQHIIIAMKPLDVALRALDLV